MPKKVENVKVWNRTQLIASHETKSLIREWGERYPDATYEVDDWRRSMHSPGVLQGLADLKKQSLPEWGRAGVDTAAVEVILDEFSMYPVVDRTTHDRVQKEFVALLKAVRGIHQLAMEGLLPGRLNEATVQAAGTLMVEAEVSPTPGKDRPGAPRKDFWALRASKLVELLEPYIPKPYHRVADILNTFGYGQTPEAVRKLVRGRSKQ